MARAWETAAGRSGRPAERARVAADHRSGILLAMQRTVGNAAVVHVLRNPVDPQDGGPAGGHDSFVLWFERDSVRLRGGAAPLLADAVAAVRAHLSRNPRARVPVDGFASQEGTASHNLDLSRRRAIETQHLLESGGVPAGHLDPTGRGVSRTWPDAPSNRRVEIGVSYDTNLDPPAPPPPTPREPTDDERHVMGRLNDLASKVQAQESGDDAFQFVMAVKAFDADLKAQLTALNNGQPLPDGLKVVLKALYLWERDDGRTWGRNAWFGYKNSLNVMLSSPSYATVGASMNKCNIYVAEVLYRTFGTVQKVYESDTQQGRYFPYRAGDWSDPAKHIDHYPVVSDPKMGDVWARDGHMGLYLGTYNGRVLYISARNDTDGVFGADAFQQKHGLQIKFAPDGGTVRRHSASR